MSKSASCYRLEPIRLPAVEFAALFDFSATVLAAFAVLAGLFVAIIGTSLPALFLSR